MSKRFLRALPLSCIVFLFPAIVAPVIQGQDAEEPKNVLEALLNESKSVDEKSAASIEKAAKFEADLTSRLQQLKQFAASNAHIKWDPIPESLTYEAVADKLKELEGKILQLQRDIVDPAQIADLAENKMNAEVLAKYYQGLQKKTEELGLKELHDQLAVETLNKESLKRQSSKLQENTAIVGSALADSPEVEVIPTDADELKAANDVADINSFVIDELAKNEADIRRFKLETRELPKFIGFYKEFLDNTKGSHSLQAVRKAAEKLIEDRDVHIQKIIGNPDTFAGTYVTIGNEELAAAWTKIFREIDKKLAEVDQTNNVDLIRAAHDAVLKGFLSLQEYEKTRTYRSSGATGGAGGGSLSTSTGTVNGLFRVPDVGTADNYKRLLKLRREYIKKERELNEVRYRFHYGPR